MTENTQTDGGMEKLQMRKRKKTAEGKLQFLVTLAL